MVSPCRSLNCFEGLNLLLFPELLISVINSILVEIYISPMYFPFRYAHYDANESFSDFTAYGGWTEPHAKQYSGDAVVCG